MKKLKMQFDNNLTFKKGCEKYLDNCRQRNLREGTINHYRQSYRQFYKFFNPEMPVEELTKEKYNKYVIYLRDLIRVYPNERVKRCDIMKYLV